MANIEIEYGVKVINGDELMKHLESLTDNRGVTKMRRVVYKQGGDYFVRVSYEESEKGQKKYVFSLKEDVMAKGKSEDGLKQMQEIDIVLDKGQLDQFVEVIGLMGYKKDNDFTKTRYWYEIDDLHVSLDKTGAVDYLEVEGASKDQVMNFVEDIPIEEAK